MMTDGILLLNKPKGLSSHQALQKARRLLGVKKAGHAGTLDPMATGMLPLYFGQATKLLEITLQADKCYEATLRLGSSTTTGDEEGEMVEQRLVSKKSVPEIEAIFMDFKGEIQWDPSKPDGQPRRMLEVSRAKSEFDFRAGTAFEEGLQKTITWYRESRKGN